jgi:hypothetical protein
LGGHDVCGGDHIGPRRHVRAGHYLCTEDDMCSKKEVSYSSRAQLCTGHDLCPEDHVRSQGRM